MAHAQLLLVLLATLVAASRAAFPWCSCVDYSPSSSPYSLSLISTVATTDNVTAVFRVNALPLSSSPSICYQTLLNNGIEKIEIASQLACLRNVRVLIDGLPSSASGATLPANYRTVANIKVKFSTLVRSSGTIITIIGSGACSSWPALFGGRPLGSFIYAVFNWGTGASASYSSPSGRACTSWSCRVANDYTYQLAAADVDRDITITTCVDGVDAWDTFLFAFPTQGSSCPTCPVAVSDDNGGPCGQRRSQLTITALAGQAYTVVVEGFSTRIPGFTDDVSARSCSNPQIIDVGIGSGSVIPSVSTCNTTSSQFCQGTTGADYTYQLAAAAFNRTITVTTCVNGVAAYDTVILAFATQGTSCPNCPLGRTFGNDNGGSCGQGRSQLTFTVPAGQTYTVVVENYPLADRTFLGQFLKLRMLRMCAQRGLVKALVNALNHLLATYWLQQRCKAARAECQCTLRWLMGGSFSAGDHDDVKMHMPWTYRVNAR
ncbi:hypothetical protein V8C86DRAFT_3033591 [Haematococcus lacustris]